MRSNEPKDPARVKQGKASRDRGQRGEREVCKILSEIFGYKITRNLSQTRDSGGDIDAGPFLLEVKFQNRLKLPEWIAQVETAAKARDMLPALAFRRDNEKWKVVLDLEVFAQIVNGLRGGHHRTSSVPDRGAGASGSVSGEAATGS